MYLLKILQYLLLKSPILERAAETGGQSLTATMGGTAETLGD
jgi:hypothetical protein